MPLQFEPLKTTLRPSSLRSSAFPTSRPVPPPFVEVARLEDAVRAKRAELAAAVKRVGKSGPTALPNAEIHGLVGEIMELQTKFVAEFERVRTELGFTDEMLDAIEEADNKDQIPIEPRYSRDSVEVPSTANIDRYLASAIARVEEICPPDWLRAEQEKQFRLPASLRSRPLHIVGGMPIPTEPAAPQAHPLARMLFLARDYLSVRADFDFFSSAMALPELVTLSRSFEAIARLGPEGKGSFLSCTE